MIVSANLPQYTQTEMTRRESVIVPHHTKQFAEKLNYCLDSMGAPPHVRERAGILSKLLDLSKQQAWSLLSGQQAPAPDTLQKIASEFEVDLNWLAGE